MLTKMGWAPGKGLGANEDGNTEHVKVRLKDNNFGIGANKKNMDNWLDNTDAFSRLLADLNERVGSEQSSPAPESPSSKEDQSEESNNDSSEKKSKKKSKKEKKDKKDKKSKKEKKSRKSKKEESSDEEDDTVVVAATTTTFRNA
jgi:Pin2-interacting protein X1